MIPERPVQSFDEKAALAELERLRESIQAARKARQRTSDEFDAFVKGFRTPASTPISEPPVAIPRPSAAAPPQAVAEPIDRPPQTPDSFPSPAVVPADTDAFDEKTVSPPADVPGRFKLNIGVLGIVGGIAAIALGFVLTRSPKPDSPPAPVNAVTDNPAPTTSAGTSTPAASPLAPPAAAHSVVLELKIVRPVWMRVVVDGRKDVEGMVQSGEPLHFAGDQSIVVRVGNGGDVLVKTGDREESFGETGQPLTRTFSRH